ncbi:MAG TPA: pyridoxamine 5'-phosphate oxidase family protein [Arenibaculum sp.]|nr:pyridoxamine 5'-phosphate oxidase family protein [Arenibaculum sp.]
MSFYHEGSRALQDRFDSRRIADRLFETRRHETFTLADREIIEKASFFFLATADASGWPDCSIKAGMPGFVGMVAPNALVFPDYDGNGMFRSLGNMAVNPHVGLLFLETSGERRKLRINGIASVTDADGLLASLPGAKLAVRVTATDIFPNCPRYVPTLDVVEPSVYAPRRGHRPPEPAWKSKPDLKDFVPSR